MNKKSPDKDDRAQAERKLISLEDIQLCLVLPFWFLLSWIVPQDAWKTVVRGLVYLSRSRGQLNHEAKTFAVKLEEVTRKKAARSLAIGYHASRIEHFFQILRDYRPGGWKPEVEIVGLDYLKESLANGKGAVLWVGHFAFNGLAPKLALHRAGYAFSHLSRPEHGFSKTRFGIRVLNPIRSRVEDRYLKRRILITRGRESIATRELRDCLNKGEIVSITAGAWEGRMVEKAPIFGSSLPLSTGAPSLARSTGAALLPLFAVREAGSNVLRIIIDRPIDLGSNLPREEARSHAISEFASRMEPWVRKCPEQWRDWHYIAPDFKYSHKASRGRKRISWRFAKEKLTEARIAEENGDLQAAMTICGEILETRPEHYGARKLTAELLCQTGRTGEAQIIIDSLITEEEKKHRLVQLYILKSKLAEMENDFSTAIRLCRSALELDNTHSGATKHLINLFAFGRQWEELDYFLADLIKDPSKNVECVAHAIRHMMNFGRFEPASTWLDRLLEFDDTNPFVTLLLFKLYRRKKDEEKAKQVLLNTAREGKLSAVLTRNLALEMHGIGLLDEAARMWKRYQIMEPASYDAFFALADYHIRSEKFDEAIKLINMIAVYPNDRGRSISLINSILARQAVPRNDIKSTGWLDQLTILRNQITRGIPHPFIVELLEEAKAKLTEIRRADLFATALPKITLVCPIHRPGDLSNAVTQLMRQLWGNLETIIALHTDKIGQEDVDRLWTADRHVRVIDCTDCPTLGAVLNRAIRASSGDLIFKMDSDDLYFPNYVTDMACSLEYYRADVVVKKAKFRMFEDFGLLVLEYPQMINQKAKRGAQAGGTSICLRRNVFERFPFQEEFSTAEDTVFFTQITIAGMRIFFVDPFNHVAQRSADRHNHSWKTDSRIMLLGERTSNSIGDQTAISYVEI